MVCSSISHARKLTRFTVPARNLLIIEDASASAVDFASASTPNNPGIVSNVPVLMVLRTDPSGVVSMGSADHVIVAGVGLPTAGGRTVKGYAAPGTDVLFVVGGCTVPVNTNVYFWESWLAILSPRSIRPRPPTRSVRG